MRPQEGWTGAPIVSVVGDTVVQPGVLTCTPRPIALESDRIPGVDEDRVLKTNVEIGQLWLIV